MNTGRLEAFSDGVMAVAITIMVLEVDVPQHTDLAALSHVVPELLTYALSFVYIGIYWSNHHHLLQAAERVSGPVLWANLHLLFWLTLIPMTTAWVGENYASAWPTAIYGAVLLFAALAYFILVRRFVALHGADSPLAQAIGRDAKNKISAVLYAAAIPLAFVHTAIADVLYVVVAVIWLVPDRRIESTLGW
ncbi:MAG: TMEM175 family protein [Salinisphaera sp.]|nr:TMEM175 family protein [Salinisphaera sp.]